MEGTFKLMGVLAAMLGFFLARGARGREGVFAAFQFLVGVGLLAAGAYLIFVEDGQGAARWLPFLR